MSQQLLLKLGCFACLTGACTPRPSRAPAQAPAPSQSVDNNPVSDSQKASARTPDLLARTSMVFETRFDIDVEDEYRWMETHTQELQDWIRRHDARTRSHLAKLDHRDALFARIKELLDESSETRLLTIRNNTLFYLRQSPGENQPSLVARHYPNGKERILFDPTKQQPPGAIDNYMPSPDGKLIAINWSSHGSEIGSIVFVETDTGKLRKDSLPRVWGEFPAQWTSDGKQVAYTQMLEPQTNVDPMLNMRVLRHRLGTSLGKDEQLLQAGNNPSMKFLPQEFPILEFSKDGKWAVATGRGARPDMRLAFASADNLSNNTRWTTIAEYSDQIQDYFIDRDLLYVLTTKDAANGKVVAYKLRSPNLEPTVVVPHDPTRTLESIHPSKNGLYVKRMNNGSEQLSWHKYGSSNAIPVSQSLPGSIDNINALGESDEIAFHLEGWTTPPRYYQWSPQTKTARELSLPSRAPADFSNVVVRRVEVPGIEHAMVPMTLLLPKDLKMNGEAPFHVRAYGGYGLTMVPRYFPSQLAWLERGGGLAFVHVRGGGAKGRAWHDAGRGKNKKIGVDDLLAGIRYLSEQGYSSPSHIAVQGASMGGVLVGGALVTAPDAFNATILSVPLLNPLRMLAAANGANDIAELGGSPETAEGYSILHAMDPYHKIDHKNAYPPTMFEVGLNDNRVPLWHAGKFAARLLVNNPKNEVWIRADADGHGIGTPRDMMARKLADRYAFLLSVLSSGQSTEELRLRTVPVHPEFKKTLESFPEKTN